MAAATPMTYRFGEFEVDESAYEMRQAGARVRLTRQPMEILLLLLERRQELVSRDEMANRLWKAETFTDADAGIHTAILKIRQALGDSREAPRYVETVSGKGYRFVAPVEVIGTRATSISASASLPPGMRQVPRRHNLPAEVTSFVGRGADLLEVPRLLATSRLVSLTGAGGVGKTRLALRVAAGLVHDFADGVWLIDLASLTVPDLLAQTVATALDIREGAQRTARDVLLDALHERELLLVLDTCEHLIGSCAALADDLLRHTPAVRILATSREALGVPGETVYRVASLAVPDLPQRGDPPVESDATRLFVERARAITPDFGYTPGNAEPIARICRRLDGIPLAIELAAARAVVLSPEQIEARLDDRFRLLTGGARTAVARQRTLEATVDWSCQLLSDVERLLLSRLSVFPATWSLEASEHACQGGSLGACDVLDLLSELVSKSLVVVVADGAAGKRRYRFLETIRQFALERLLRSGEAGELRQRHFDFFFQEFRGALPMLRHHHQLSWLRRIGLEQENVRAALDWGLSSPGQEDRAVELAGALFWFWTKRGLYQEGRLWLERALAAATAQNGRARSRALIGLAHMHHFQGRPFDDLVSEALDLGRGDEDEWTISFALFMQAMSAFERGDLMEATARANEAFAAAGASEELLVQRAAPLFVLASVAVSRGDYEVAQPLYDEAIDACRRSGETWGLGILLSAAAGLGIVRGHLTQAHEQLSEALSIYQEVEDPRGIAWSLDVFAGLLAASQRTEESARSWGAADRLLETVGGSLAPEIRWVRARYLESARTSLGAQTFDAARAAGREMSLSDAIARTRDDARSASVE